MQITFSVQIPKKYFLVLDRWAQDNNSTPSIALCRFLQDYRGKFMLMNRPAHLLKKR